MTIRRGEICFVDLNPIKGREQAGQRPVLVLSIDEINSLPLVITVIVGTKGENISRDYPTNVRVLPEESGLPAETVFLCFQIRSLASQPVSRKAGGNGFRGGVEEDRKGCSILPGIVRFHG